MCSLQNSKKIRVKGRQLGQETFYKAGSSDDVYCKPG